MSDYKLINDHFQNYKVYGIPKAQLIIADIPYNIGKNAYGSNPSWYINGDNSNGESELAGKEVHVFMPISQEPELMYKIYDSVLTEFDQLITIGAMSLNAL